MGLKFAGSETSGTPPTFETGMFDARFEGVEAKVIEKSQFDPNVFIWQFTLLDDDGKVIYDEGEPLEVEKVTSQSVNVKSKTTPGAVKVLKALMTEAEFAAFERGEELDADELVGRTVQVQVIKKDSGWPGVEEVLPARRRRSSK